MHIFTLLWMSDPKILMCKLDKVVMKIMEALRMINLLAME